MKIIDLLNKIANGEEVPKKIYYKGDIWYLEQDFSNRLPYYKNGYNMDNLLSGEEKDYFSQSLNDEVEIIEEEKKVPEKLNLKVEDWTTPSQCDIELSKKIDEIIDYLYYLKSKGE